MSNKKRTLTPNDIKTALSDDRFTDKLPDYFKDDVAKFRSNKNCPCNQPLYNKLVSDPLSVDQLNQYFPGLDMKPIEQKQHKNHWSVINCSIDELESKLKSLGTGRKQISMARYEDQITLVVNDLEYYI